jgi:hypothetical protein
MTEQTPQLSPAEQPEGATALPLAATSPAEPPPGLTADPFADIPTVQMQHVTKEAKGHTGELRNG